MRDQVANLNWLLTACHEKKIDLFFFLLYILFVFLIFHIFFHIRLQFAMRDCLVLYLRVLSLVQVKRGLFLWVIINLDYFCQQVSTYLRILDDYVKSVPISAIFFSIFLAMIYGYQL